MNELTNSEALAKAVSAELSEQLDSKNLTKEELWNRTFDRMVETQHTTGVRVWFIHDGKKDVAILLRDWPIPPQITSETLISYQSLTRKERRKVIVELMGTGYKSSQIKNQLNSHGKDI